MLARDQFGKKPLYIHESREKLLFGSEIKALLAFGDMHPALDRPSIADYLLYRYVPAPHTFFAGIRKLMPGSYALWQHGQLTETSFYTPPYGLSPPHRHAGRRSHRRLRPASSIRPSRSGW